MSRTFEPGVYKGRVTRWGLTTTKTGKPQFALTFMPTAMLAGDREEAAPQFERTVYRVITDKTIEYFVQDLEALGYDRDNFDALSPDHPDAFDFLDKEVRVSLEYEDYQGKDQERWNLAMRAAPAVKPLERREVSALNSQFGSRLKALKGRGPAQRQAQQAPQRKTIEQEADEVF